VNVLSAQAIANLDGLREVLARPLASGPRKSGVVRDPDHNPANFEKACAFAISATAWEAVVASCIAQ
jgi:hypothetical protein